MGYNLTKRVAGLKKQADEHQEGRWSLVPTVFLVTLGLAIFSSVVLPHHNYSSEKREKDLSTWHNSIQNQFNDRFKWLQESPLVLFSGAAEAYGRFAESIVDTFPTQDSGEASESDEFTIDFASMWIWFNRMIAGVLLRMGFVFIAFWPLWILSLLAGTFALKSRFSTAKTEDMLGVCDRGNGPFYSGIYGPLRPNNSTSGTDLSCPSLACPVLEKRNTALTSKLTLLLKEHSAYNETNFDLVRVILAHSDFPTFVAEENPAYEEHETNGIPDEARVSQTGFVTNEGGTLKDGATTCLQSVLEAHKKIRGYVESLEKKGVKPAALSKNYPAHLGNLKKLTSTMSPLAKLLTISLTPNRIWALGHIEPAVIASAYLATEAGKCLVYKRHSEGFVRISNYPHLQARAIIQSIPSYHREYNGDVRLTIRQAILCSRRHGDFGRAFLPVRMLPESRAIRDWLEILYAEPDKRTDSAYLVELDAHIEEISVSWRAGLGSRLKEHSRPKTNEGTAASVAARVSNPYSYWKGLVYKSVVLMPLSEVVEISLEGHHEQRLKRVTQLLELTRKYQTRISISARLPGFKRQAMEAERSGEVSDKVVQNVLESPGGEALLERWRIVRRMLTRYNWLSTRVGDDAVPIMGLVQGIVQSATHSDFRLRGYEAVVPLRQRRLNELLGRQWEQIFFHDTPTPEEISVYVKNEDYLEALRLGPRAPSAPEDASSPSPDPKSAAQGGG